ncbi:MAG: transcriptional regulator [Anaerolineales bacterium]|nr:transcriptional regulator [Anaerolineales bacterium]
MDAPQINKSIQDSVDELDTLIHAPARLKLMTMLYVVDSMDYVFLKNQSGYSWGNLSTHINKLEEAGYLSIEKGYRGRKPNTTLQLTAAGREAFRSYRSSMQQILDDLPEG